MPKLADMMPQATAYIFFTILGFTLKFLMSSDDQILTRLRPGELVMTMSLSSEMQKFYEKQAQNQLLTLTTNIKDRKCKVSIKSLVLIAMDKQIFFKIKDRDLFEIAKLDLNPNNLTFADAKAGNLPYCQSLREIHYGL